MSLASFRSRLGRFLAIDARGGKTAALYLLMVVGVMAHWFWILGWQFLRDPEAGLLFGSWSAIVVRVILAFIAAALTFVPTYNKISKASDLAWVPYFLAFQNGFFWEAAMDAVVRQF